MIYKTLLRKLKIEQHVLQKKRMNSGALERIASGTCSVTVKRHKHYVIWKSHWTPVCKRSTNYINNT